MITLLPENNTILGHGMLLSELDRVDRIDPDTKELHIDLEDDDLILIADKDKKESKAVSIGALKKYITEGVF